MFTRADGTPGRVARASEIVEEQPLTADVPLVLQVSRWDQLKDPLGVMEAFSEQVASRTDAHLMLAGPSTTAVADDPEAATVLGAVQSAWHDLPSPVRRRVHLASLPMEDLGFGLTVSEAMWKQRPVVASRIGGIRDQIEHGRSGLLADDPRDLEEVGTSIAGLITDTDRATTMGLEAQRRVRQQFLGPHHPGRYFEVIRRVDAHRETSGPH